MGGKPFGDAHLARHTRDRHRTQRQSLPRRALAQRAAAGDFPSSATNISKHQHGRLCPPAREPDRERGHLLRQRRAGQPAPLSRTSRASAARSSTASSSSPSAARGYADDQANLTATVQTALGENFTSNSTSSSSATSTSSSAIQNALSSFFGALQNLAASPTDTSARQDRCRRRHRADGPRSNKRLHPACNK